MGEAFNVESAESQAAQEIQRRIGDHLSYADRVYGLLDLAIGHYDECEVKVGSVDYVALLLMGRMANDMRAIGRLARLGYGVQACALAASVFELACTFIGIVTDDKRAAEWSNHTDPARSFMSVQGALNQFVGRMQWSEEQNETAKRRQRTVYQDLCQFKHGNPRSMLPRTNGEGYVDNRLGPDTTDFELLTATNAILHAGWHVGLALHQWADARPLLAAARIRFCEELAALVRHQEEVDDQTRSLKARFDGRTESARYQQD